MKVLAALAATFRQNFYLMINGLGLPVVVFLAGGQGHDAGGFAPLMAELGLLRYSRRHER